MEDYARIIIKQSNTFDGSKYEQVKVWDCYSEGFGCVHWGLVYHNDANAYDIYSQYFDESDAILLEEYVKQENILDIPMKNFVKI